jgi:hypothetical protein
MKFGETKVVNLLGKWKESKYFGQAIPVGGFAYYLTTPPTYVSIQPYSLFFLRKEICGLTEIS